LTSITIGTSASLQGRALARNGTVTMDSNAITACAGGTGPGFLVPPVAPLATAATRVPTLSQWGLIILAILIALTTAATLRRRKR